MSISHMVVSSVNCEYGISVVAMEKGAFRSPSTTIANFTFNYYFCLVIFIIFLNLLMLQMLFWLL